MRLNRDMNMDALRILGAFMVVSIHTIPECINNYSLILQSIVRSGLPIFFMISGMFILKSKINNIWIWYYTRIISLVIPFLIFGYLHLEIVSQSIANSHATPSVFFDLILKSTTALSGHYWFVYSIFGIYIIAPAINAIITNINEQMALRAFIILMILNAINIHYTAIQQLTGLRIENIFSIPQVFVWLHYFINGFLIYKSIKLISWKMIFFMFSLGLSLTIYFTYITPNKYGITFSQYDQGVSMFLLCSGLFASFVKIENIFSKTNNITLKAIEVLSKNTYGIYLIHISILISLPKVMPNLFAYLNAGKFYITESFIIFASSFFICAIANPLIDLLISIMRNISKLKPKTSLTTERT